MRIERVSTGFYKLMVPIATDKYIPYSDLYMS